MLSREEMSWKRAALLAVLFALVWRGWDSPTLYPLRILVTLFHEFGHGLAALLSGGSIDRITVDPGAGGVCYTRGGWRWLILPSGYLGSMAGGCAILLLACRTRWDRALSLLLGAGVAGTTLLYVRTPVGLLYGVGSGLALAAAGRWLGEEANDLLLSFIGVTSCLYAFMDLRILIRLGRGYNDATMFSTEIFPLPPAVWAVLWAAIALAALAFTLGIALRRDARS